MPLKHCELLHCSIDKFGSGQHVSQTVSDTGRDAVNNSWAWKANRSSRLPFAGGNQVLNNTVQSSTGTRGWSGLKSHVQMEEPVPQSWIMQCYIVISMGSWMSLLPSQWGRKLPYGLTNLDLVSPLVGGSGHLGSYSSFYFEGHSQVDLNAKLILNRSQLFVTLTFSWSVRSCPSSCTQ